MQLLACTQLIYTITLLQVQVHISHYIRFSPCVCVSVTVSVRILPVRSIELRGVAADIFSSFVLRFGPGIGRTNNHICECYRVNNSTYFPVPERMPQGHVSCYAASGSGTEDERKYNCTSTRLRVGQARCLHVYTGYILVP